MSEGLIAGYYAELDILCIVLLGLLIVKTAGSSFISNQKKCFEIVLLCHIVFTASDLIWIFNNGFLSLLEIFPDCGVTLSYLLNSLNVIASSVTGFSWLVFSETMQKHDITQDRKKMAVYLLPIIILALLTVTTGSTRIMFAVSGQGKFSRGPGYALQVLVSMGYVILASVLSARRAIRGKTLQERRTSRAIVGFVKAPICAIVLQLLFPRIQILFLGTILSLVSVYISLQQMQVLTDPLTGLNNRMLLDQKFSSAVQFWSDDSDVYLMLIDADGFKKINDEHGHIVGDKVLTLIADALRKNCGSADYVCRYGGDEFVILHRAPRGADCAQIEQRINGTLAACSAPCPVSVSIGVCRYTPDIRTLDAFVNAADEAMYRVKADRKSKK